jgi:hypothetical protein
MKKLILAGAAIAAFTAPALADVGCFMKDTKGHPLMWEFGANSHNSNNTLGTYVEKRSANLKRINNWTPGARPIWIWRAYPNGSLISLQDRQNPGWTIQLGDPVSHNKGLVQVQATLLNNGVFKGAGQCAGAPVQSTVNSVGDQGIE